MSRGRADDPCCRECRTPFAGVCRRHHGCDCHKAARKEVASGRYAVRDPTGTQAVNNAMNNPRRRTGT